MTWIIANWKLVIGFVLLIAALGIGAYGGYSFEHARWEHQKLLDLQAQQKAQDENQKLKDQLEVTKNANDKIVSDLHDELRTVRVRVPKACVQPPTASGSTVPVTSTSDIPDASQAAFDDFRLGLEQDARDADKAIEQCRVVMDWAKALPK